MFNLIKRYNKQKDLIDRELAVYKREKLNEIEIELRTKRNEIHDQINKLAYDCATQTANYEHEFHNNKEEKGIELAKLNEQVQNAQEKLEYITEIIKLKEENAKKFEVSGIAMDERERLYGIVDKLLGAQAAK